MIVRLRRTWSRPLGRCIMAVLPPFNFLTLHYAYFIATPLICSIIFWGSATPSRSVHYADALFMCVSAMTGAGLNTVDLSSLNTFQQSILFALLILGHAILISITVLFVRKRAFQLKFKTISESSAARNLFGQSTLGFLKPAGKTKTHTSQPEEPHSPEDSKASATENVPLEASNTVDNDHSRWDDDDQITIGHMQPRHHHPHRVFPMAGVGARLDLNNHPRDVAPTIPLDGEPDEIPRLEGILRDTQKYFASKGFISRNSQFHGLTFEEREKLGGVEYKAVSFLLVIVLLYWSTFLIIGIVGVGGWLEVNHPEIPRANGLSPFWTGTFFAVSAFVNSGMSLLDANMTALQTNTYPLLTMGMLILAGNTLYPCFLRFIIWTMRRLMTNRPSWETWKVTLDFILDHPRRVYTNLFPVRHTWYLLGTIIILNGIDWAGFEVLAIGNKEIETLPAGYRILDGLFQALAVRSGGFYVVTISELRQGLLVLYVLMMYVSAFPVLVTMRNTNVYEERSLGIYASDEPLDAHDSQSPNFVMSLIRHHLLGRQNASMVESSRSYFVHQQLRSQLSHDIWWIALAVFFITIAESPHYSENPVAYSTFNIIFEVVSAYGCVGISVGFPGKNYSFCGSWHTVSKLILAAVTLRGRHRGLPVAIDQAVMLPSESLAWAEEEDAVLRREQTRMYGSEKMPVGTV
ncbi:low-affinity potassium transport protein [Aspergillus lentulus]|uniref:Low-affinity potassium transport protein n=2 Tax=Aspergillus lentulus TaxID=293939 RepID=A0ABQ1A835_ASPLE|nr:low-affinity potassium transport protein [Aspergillus lentulus]GFF31724.1 low-affinity potassium transport protein [Aspergillus lentulus]GFF58328.1 low-affinity potassium transport protein [Aspergillus lentulus]GFF75871.1 low-affinity potassium transport protein [Aspergillus lentulus]GFF79068.1 low-affinity potassium transport protein [Aspergillus lentulus]